MSRDLIAFTIGPGICALCWLLSLRRTPWAVAWFFVCLCFSLIAIAAGIGVKHTTAGGDIAIAFGITLTVVICAICTEITAEEHEPGGAIARWRNGRRPRKVKGRWKVQPVMGNDSGVIFYATHPSGARQWIDTGNGALTMDDRRALANEFVRDLNRLHVRPQ